LEKVLVECFHGLFSSGAEDGETETGETTDIDAQTMQAESFGN